MAKATKKQVLGRGLSALLSDSSEDITSIKDKNADKLVGNIVEIELDAIEVNPFQPRTNFNEDSLMELASSIKELGVIQPITVRKIDFNKASHMIPQELAKALATMGLIDGNHFNRRSKGWIVGSITIGQMASGNFFIIFQ